jgi:hypothetical protein
MWHEFDDIAIRIEHSVSCNPTMVIVCPLNHEDPRDRFLDLCHLYNGTVAESFITAHGGSEGINALPFHVYLKGEAGRSIRWINTDV